MVKNNKSLQDNSRLLNVSRGNTLTSDTGKETKYPTEDTRPTSQRPQK